MTGTDKKHSITVRHHTQYKQYNTKMQKIYKSIKVKGKK
jgi:hypothetical protein